MSCTDYQRQRAQRAAETLFDGIYLTSYAGTTIEGFPLFTTRLRFPGVPGPTVTLVSDTQAIVSWVESSATLGRKDHRETVNVD
jgi:hypothetical protein